ncbi:aspartate aminotransferase family protein [Ectothiorhodospiraceae bacterium BW-2]|nr:aspartate aminotransferase family protein [Ectothiorhodospiraceae bacterium BW-2]
MVLNDDIFTTWESDIRAYCRAVPTVFQSSSNAVMIDENGKRYIDFFAGAGVLNFGHNNPAMKAAMIEFLQADGVAHSLDMYTTTKRDFIEKFAETILKPRNMNYKMQFTGPTGTNAVEAALKLARRVTQRETVVAFTQAFHGMTLGSLACTSNHYFRNASGVALEGVLRHPFGCERKCASCDMGCGMAALEQLRAQFNDPSSGIEPPAAFLLETIQAEGGVRVASRQWLHAVQQLAEDSGALLIIDDIQVGCGRTGSYFSFDGMGLDPDIIVLAKGLGGFGTPLAMTLNKPEYDKLWHPGEHTGTFRGQGLSFVAGRVALGYFDNSELMEQVADKGATMRHCLDSVAAHHTGLEVRGRGMIQAVEFAEGAVTKAIAKRCFESGLIIGACGGRGNILKFIPPLTIPAAELQQGLDIFAAAVAAELSGAELC